MGLEAIKSCLLEQTNLAPADATDGADADVTTSFVEPALGKRLFHQPCFATRLAGVSGGNEIQG